MENVTCGNTEFVVRELPEKLRVLNTVDPDSGDSLLVAEFKVCACVRVVHACACSNVFAYNSMLPREYLVFDEYMPSKFIVKSYSPVLILLFQNLGLGDSDSDSFITASQPENKAKNRYAILPCELKVPLEQFPGADCLS